MTFETSTIRRAPSGAGSFDLVLDASSGSVEIPGRDFLLDADFVRSGPDLVLEGGDRETILVRDFSPPARPLI